MNLEARMKREAEHREYAFAIFKTALCVAGVPLKEMEVIETGTDDRYVRITFNDGAEELVDITRDNTPRAFRDVLNQSRRLMEQD